MSTQKDKQDDHSTQIDINSSQNTSGLLSASTEHPGLEFTTPESVQKNILGDIPEATESEKKAIKFFSHPITFIINSINIAKMNKIHFLLLFIIPAAIWKTSYLSFFAIIPLSNVMTIAIEDLTARCKKPYASVLHAFSGNFVELVIETVALIDRKYNIVRSAVLGAILCNITLVLGIAFLAGAMPTRSRQTRASQSSIHLKDSEFKAKLFVNTSASVLALAVLALVIPTAFKIAATPQMNNELNSNNINCDIQNISHATAIILMTIYIGTLIFQLKTHVEDTLNAMEVKQGEVLYAWYFDVFLLVGSVVGITFFAMFLVRDLEELAEHHHIGSGFIGIVILPICVVCNFIEHYEAIKEAFNDRVDTAVSLILNTSVQMTLLVTPLLVLIGWAVDRQLSLDFNVLELSMLACAVLVVNFLVADNMATWLEGYMLVASYLLMAIAFFYFPEQSDTEPAHCSPFSRNLISNNNTETGH
ncbi:calcium/proton exchanger [Gigaspora margarita]|uniref:Calcium/proton exchanger n=1 Tax=Gigaspora margarita TaxID=4874 RepID=A0A8H4AAB0_GIGMA|nr:calcium/proton exchanger [Gigaspora margarita]